MLFSSLCVRTRPTCLSNIHRYSCILCIFSFVIYFTKTIAQDKAKIKDWIVNTEKVEEKILTHTLVRSVNLNNTCYYLAECREHISFFSPLWQYWSLNSGLHTSSTTWSIPFCSSYLGDRVSLFSLDHNLILSLPPLLAWQVLYPVLFFLLRW
jgi:hypothetical protein